MTRLMYQLVCGGRRVNDQLQAVGPPCGRVYRNRDPDQLHRRARAAGWSVIYLPEGGLAVCCPTCRKPDPAIAALAATLPKGR